MLACTVRTSSPPLFCHHFTFPISFLYLSSPPQSFGCPRLAFNWLFFVERAMITYQALTRPFGCLCVPPRPPSPSPQGYLFISVLVNSNSELIRLINNAIKNDLSSRNPTFMCLALHCIANVGSREMAEAFAGEIPRILVAG